MFTIFLKQITTTLEMRCCTTTSKWKWGGGASGSCGKYFPYSISQTEVSDGGKNTPMLSLIRNNDKQVLLSQMQMQNLEYPPPCFNARGDDVAWHHSVKMQSNFWNSRQHQWLGEMWHIVERKQTGSHLYARLPDVDTLPDFVWIQRKCIPDTDLHLLMHSATNRTKDR